MYLFVFIWVPSLQEAATLNFSEPLSLGYIFSSFMVSMMLGSILYTSIVTRLLGSDSGTSGDSSPVLHAKLSSLVCAMSALALVTSIVSESEKIRFWAFCVFEACVGMYYPVQGMLRGTFVSNEHRATVRVSLFSFLVRVLFIFCWIGSSLPCSAFLSTYSS
jgi:MFS transporter, MFS domain-containing protein family, molybdate-anion transporter